MDSSRRRRHRRSRTRKKAKPAPRGRQKLTPSNGIRIVLVFVLLVAVFLVGKNLFYFVTESGTDPDQPYPVKGVDVSNYQKEIDWKGLESEGIRFAFIKATEGSSHVDKRFAYNWEEAGKTEMKIGAYHFMSYDTSGEDQAANFIETVDKQWGMLPPVIDVEFYGAYTENHPSKQQMYNILDVLLEELEAEYGKKPLIYTNSHIYETYISGRYDEYSVWISDPDIPQTLPDGREWTFCQYTFSDRSPYVANGEKNVDMNVFNGSEWEFRRYSGN